MGFEMKGPAGRRVWQEALWDLDSVGSVGFGMEMQVGFGKRLCGIWQEALWDLLGGSGQLPLWCLFISKAGPEVCKG